MSPLPDSANITSLISENAEYSSNVISAAEKALPLPPAKGYTVVTCMDARIIPSHAFGIDLGDAHVIRNAGGSARDALRSLVISQQLLGTREVIVVKHTDCGMLTFTNGDIHSVITTNLGVSAEETQSRVPDFLPFAELEQAVLDDVSFLKETKVSGWVYDVRTGAVKRVI